MDASRARRKNYQRRKTRSLGSVIVSALREGPPGMIRTCMPPVRRFTMNPLCREKAPRAVRYSLPRILQLRVNLRMIFGPDSTNLLCQLAVESANTSDQAGA
jgi:hypothetical protein